MRAALFDALHYRAGGSRLGYWVAISIQALILINVVAVVIESVDAVSQALGHEFFVWLERGSILIFSIEYLLRLWSCVEDSKFRHPVWGRLRFALSPLALIDLLAIAPFFLPTTSVDLRVMRLLRTVRIFRLGKLGRYSKALQVLGRVLKKQREELLSALFLFGIATILAASLIYFAEGEAQPEKFTSIPEAMWWAVVTLTTVGYGDVVPVTSWGKFIAATSSVVGVTLFALFAGILVTGFVEEVRSPK